MKGLYSFLIALIPSGMVLQAVILFSTPGNEYGVVLSVLVVWLLIPLVVARWIYRDATGRDRDHALAWTIGAVASGITSFVVLLLYIATRDAGSDG